MENVLLWYNIPPRAGLMKKTELRMKEKEKVGLRFYVNYSIFIVILCLINKVYVFLTFR